MECYYTIMSLNATSNGQSILRGLASRNLESLIQVFTDEFPSYFYYGPIKTAQDLQNATRAIYEALSRAKRTPHCTALDICLVALFGNHI